MTTKLTNNSTNKVQEFQFHSIPHDTKWVSFQKTIYDPATQQILGRTKENWYRLLTFYTLFYVCLGILFSICMRAMLSTLNDRSPKWTLDNGLIGTNPGLGFRPMSEETRQGSLIWYDLRDPCTASKWVKLIDEFLQPYMVEQMGKNYQVCDFDKPVKKDHVCIVDVGRFGPCTADNRYGYNSSSPCVFLKLNRIYGWQPVYVQEPLKDMPADLKEAVKTAANTNQTEVWISCEGQQGVDQERIGGFEYFPSKGFPGYYFPYLNTPNYLSPLIAVQIKNIKPNGIVNIECRAWAKNINYNGGDQYREGSVHFEILVDDPKDF